MLKLRAKKILALLMTLALVLGMLPVSVLAEAAYGGTNQVMYGGGVSYYDVNGDKTTEKGKNKVVDVSKTVTQIGENQFTVNLDVKTSMKVDEIKSAKDTAVVLVMDVSGSMADDSGMKCPECGNKNTHASKCELKDKMHLPVSRMAAAKDAALSFLETYHNSGIDGATPIAKRFVCIVEFDGEGRRIRDWVDVSTDNGYSNAKSAIGTLVGDGKNGTNIEAGLLLARNNLLYNKTALINSEGEEIDSHYVVLLTDGAANANVKGNQDSELLDVSFMNDNGSGSASGWAKDAADRVKGIAGKGTTQSKATLYTIACGGANQTWLKNSIASNAKTALDAGNIDTLNSAFIQIANSITHMAEAWVVTDPMGDSIQFAGSIVSESNSASFDADKNAIVWDLKEQPAGGNPDRGESTFHMSYNITLDNTNLNGNQSGLAIGKNTMLSYVIVDENGVATSDVLNPYKAAFLQPTVKSLFSSLSFGKISHHTVGEDKQQIPLSGAKFTLTHDKDCACGLNAPVKDTFTAISTVAENKSLVDFGKLPSGHSFVLKETEAPTGYVVDNTEYKVLTAQGKTTVDGDEWSQNSNKLQNKLDDKKVEVTITKNWQDSGNIALRPADLTVTLKGSDGKEILVSSWTNGDFVWTATVSVPTVDPETGLPITYTAIETVPENYTETNQGSVSVTFADGKGSAELTNTLKGTANVKVTKEWLAPDSERKEVEVQLVRGSYVQTVKLNINNGWTDTFKNVPLYEGGKDITGEYDVIEETKLAGFNAPTKAGSFKDGFIVTNQIAQQTIDITVNKQWVDGNSRLSTEPVTVTLKGSNGSSVEKTLDATTNSVTFDKVNQYDKKGQEIAYTVSDSVPGYTAATATVGKDKDGKYTATLTNTRADINDTIVIEGKKVWNDEENANNTRPAGENASLEMVLQQLVGDKWEQVGKSVTIHPETIEHTVTVDIPAEGEVPAGSETRTTHTYEWAEETTFTFGEMPKYTKAGKEIAYQVVEKTAPKDYVASIGTKENGYTVTNTLDSGTTGTLISVTVTKTWVDPYTDETRPTVKITVTGSNGSAVSQSTSKNETLTFADLPKYDDGKLVTYEVSETAIEGYQSGDIKVDSDNPYSVTITNRIAQATHENIVVTKKWVDALTDTSKRPAIEITLLRSDGEVITTYVKADVDANTYTYTFSGLDTYDLKSGARYTYEPKETMSGNLSARYTTGIEGYTITNTFKNETVADITGVKNWILPQGTDTVPSDKVEISLFRDSETTAVDTSEIVLSEDGKWTYTFDGANLLKYDPKDGHEYKYTVKETGVPDGFTSALLADGRTFVNTSKELSTKVNYTVNKNWVGPVDQRPASVAVELYNKADPNVTVATYDLVANETWRHVFEDLPKYDQNNALITYAVREAGMKDGKVELNGLTYAVTADAGEYTTTITNTIVQSNDVTVAGEKKWAGIEEATGFTPPAIKVQLYADGTAIEGKVAEVGSEKWDYSFPELPKYALPENGIVAATDGHQIAYSVKEVKGESGSNVFYQNGTYFYFDVTGGQGESYDLTNTLKDTEQYQYTVKGIYTTYVDGVVSASDTVDLEGPFSAKKDETPSRNEVFVNGKVEHNGVTYAYDPANSKNHAILNAGELSATKVAEIVLCYRLDKTTTSYSVEHVYTLDGVSETVPGPTINGYVGDEINVSEIIASEDAPFAPTPLHNGNMYNYNGVNHEKLTLGSDAAANKVTFTYSYTTPTYQVSVSHVNVVNESLIIDDVTKTHKITENPVTVNPLTAETGLPEGYKLITWSPVALMSTDGQPISFDANGVASINGGSGGKYIIAYYYGPAANVSVKINYYKLGDETFTPLHEAKVVSVPTYAGYDVNEFIYQQLGENKEYFFDSDSAGGVYTGTTATGDIEINVFYQANSFPYKVVYHNDYTNTDIATVYNDDMARDFGAIVTEADVESVMGSASATWKTSHIPSGYNLGQITYPTIAYSPAATQNQETGEWDASGVSNVVVVHYTYTPSGGNTDDDNGGGDDNDRPRPTPDDDTVIVIPPEDVPLDDIPDQDVPLANLPEPTVDPDDYVIVEEETPLGNLPQTGSRSDAQRAFSLLGFGALATMAGAMLINGKKREEEK